MFKPGLYKSPLSSLVVKVTNVLKLPNGKIKFKAGLLYPDGTLCEVPKWYKKILPNMRYWKPYSMVTKTVAQGDTKCPFCISPCSNLECPYSPSTP